MSLSKRAAIRAVEIAPDFGPAEARLARTLSFLGTEGVAEHYERALVLSPGDPEVIRSYVNYLREENRSGEALKLLEPVLAIEPRDPRLRSTYAMLLDANGDGSWSEDDRTFQYGQAGDLPVVGDFDGDGIDEIGVYRGGQWIVDIDGNHELNAIYFHSKGPDGKWLRVRGSNNIAMHQGTLDYFPDHDDHTSEWHQVWMPWVKSLPFHIDFGGFRAVVNALLGV